MIMSFSNYQRAIDFEAIIYGVSGAFLKILSSQNPSLAWSQVKRFKISSSLFTSRVLFLYVPFAFSLHAVPRVILNQNDLLPLLPVPYLLILYLE